MARRCVWSRNLENEEAKARYRAVKIQQRWAATPGKQTSKQTNIIINVRRSSSKFIRYSSQILIKFSRQIFENPPTSNVNNNKKFSGSGVVPY